MGAITMLFSDNNINKLLIVALLFTLLIAYTVFALIRVPIPTELVVLFGVLTGQVVYALGVKSGQNGSKTP